VSTGRKEPPGQNRAVRSNMRSRAGTKRLRHTSWSMCLAYENTRQPSTELSSTLSRMRMDAIRI
jgi:hypothetical protein